MGGRSERGVREGGEREEGALRHYFRWRDVVMSGSLIT